MLAASTSLVNILGGPVASAAFCFTGFVIFPLEFSMGFFVKFDGSVHVCRVHPTARELALAV